MIAKALSAGFQRFLRGWANYFRFGNSTRHFDKIMQHALMRLAGMVAKRHRRARGYGWWVIAFQSPDQHGLISLDGIVVAPRPHRPWQEKPNATR